MSYDKYANKPAGETKRDYRNRMRAERGDRWWRPPPTPKDDYGHEENYMRSKSGAPLYAPVPSYDMYRSLPEAEGWPSPQQAHDLSDAREMPGGAVVYMTYEWVWAMVLVPDGGGWWAYSVDPQERTGHGRVQVAPVFSNKHFASTSSLMKALRGPKGEWAVGK